MGADVPAEEGTMVSTAMVLFQLDAVGSSTGIYANWNNNNNNNNKQKRILEWFYGRNTNLAKHISKIKS